MAAEFWARIGGTWRQAREVWIRAAGQWQLAKQVYFRSGGVWRLVHNGPPRIVSASAFSVNGTEVSSVQVNATLDGTLTGWTLTIETAWSGIGSYSTQYTGSNGGTLPQTIAYWGSAFTPPPDPGEALSTDALIRISLKNGFGVHAVGSPRVLGPGITV